MTAPGIEVRGLSLHFGDRRLFDNLSFTVPGGQWVSLLGASGVVFAFIILSSVTSFRTGEIPLTFVLVAIIFLGQQIIQGLFVADNISNLSHFAGGVIGGAAGFKLGGGDKDAG